MSKVRVTTKTGDTGVTRTLAGDLISKAHPIIESGGWVDIARAQTALLRLQVLAAGSDDAAIADFLFWLLHCYFLIGTAVNDPIRKKPEYRMAEIGDEQIKRVEAEQERLLEKLDLPKAFIVSASNATAAQADVTATFVRTLERHVVGLQENMPEFSGAKIIVFLNRVSDYFYVLARYLECGKHTAVNYDILCDN